MKQPDLPKGLDWPELTQTWWEAWGRDDRTTNCTDTDLLYLMDGAVLHASVWGAGDFSKVNDLRLHMKAFEQRLAELASDRGEKIKEGTKVDELQRKRENRKSKAANSAKASNIADTHAEDVAGLSKAYGLTPDEWQYTVLEAWLGETEDGLFAASRCGLAVPRQNGKNGILEMVELYKMCILNRQILHTAHEVKTQRKAFVRLCGFFENKRQYPELAAMVKEIRRTNGQEAIVLKDGGSIEFVARSKRSARGFTVDDLVLDEAQELTEDQFAALLPTISAAKSGDPQTIMTGTPPPIFDEELAFCRMREAGNKGEDPNLAWIEWSDNRNPYEFDVKNIDHAYKTNPALGIRISERTVLDEAESMSAEMYARERLGRWADVDLSAGVFPEGLFDTLADKESHPGKQLYFAVDVSPTRDSASI